MRLARLALLIVTLGIVFLFASCSERNSIETTWATEAWEELFASFCENQIALHEAWKNWLLSFEEPQTNLVSFTPEFDVYPPDTESITVNLTILEEGIAVRAGPGHALFKLINGEWRIVARGRAFAQDVSFCYECINPRAYTINGTALYLGMFTPGTYRLVTVELTVGKGSVVGRWDADAEWDIEEIWTGTFWAEFVVAAE